jgi:hypothetical protein
VVVVVCSHRIRRAFSTCKKLFLSKPGQKNKIKKKMGINKKLRRALVLLLSFVSHSMPPACVLRPCQKTFLVRGWPAKIHNKQERERTIIHGNNFWKMSKWKVGTQKRVVKTRGFFSSHQQTIRGRYQSLKKNKKISCPS